MDHSIPNNCDGNACTSSTWTLPTAAVSSSSPPDDISLFLQQILLRSSSSAPHSSLLSPSPSIFSELTCNIRAFTPSTHNIPPPYGPSNAVPDEISAVDSSEQFANSSSSGVLHDPLRSCPTPIPPNASSTSVGASDHNENDEFDCESEVPTSFHFWVLFFFSFCLSPFGAWAGGNGNGDFLMQSLCLYKCAGGSGGIGWRAAYKAKSSQLFQKKQSRRSS